MPDPRVSRAEKRGESKASSPSLAPSGRGHDQDKVEEKEQGQTPRALQDMHRNLGFILKGVEGATEGL